MRFLRTLAISTFLAGGSLLALTQAQANTITPTLIGGPTSVGGLFRWSYSADLTGANTTFIQNGSSLTLYDFFGYDHAVVTTNNTVGTFNISTALTGPIPPTTAPVDSPAITNVTFTFSSTPPQTVVAPVTPLFTFDVFSTSNKIRRGYWGSFDQNADGDQGTAGRVNVAGDPIPEPAFIQLGSLLALGGVGGVFQLRRKRRQA